MAKIVLKEPPPPVNSVRIGDIDTSKLYVAMTERGVFKLHKLSHTPEKWAMISLFDSNCWYAGEHSTPQKAIRSCTSDVWEFHNLKELVEWLTERLE